MERAPQLPPNSELIRVVFFEGDHRGAGNDTRLGTGHLGPVLNLPLTGNGTLYQPEIPRASDVESRSYNISRCLPPWVVVESP